MCVFVYDQLNLNLIFNDFIMKFLCSILIVIVASGIFSSCQHTKAYEKSVKELDSLKVVLQQSVQNFKTLDSASCMQAYSKQYTYSMYLNSHLQDTVSKNTALNLQSFFALEKGLHDYIATRSSWLIEADFTVHQLQTLSHDLKNGSVDDEEAVEFIHNEKIQAKTIIDELNVNTETMRKILDHFHQSLPICEELIRELNQGVLPPLQNPGINYSK